MPEEPYNPLAKRQLAESVTKELLAQGRVPLAGNNSFEGAGVYAIYYSGEFAAYAHIARTELPIYVGKAVPSGSRKGRSALEAPPGTVLASRLAEHSQSIRQVENLLIEDFECRYLIVDDIWIPLAETVLVQNFEPIWNQEIDGFGNHDPGGGRYGQQRSKWDTIHPGRPWAMRCAPNNAEDELRETYGIT